MEFSCGGNERNCAFSSVLAILKRPVVIVLIVGLLIRFALAPLLTYTYDIAHWAMVMEHMQAGFGLYEVPGYYYSPVWGYMLGSFSLISSFLVDVHPMVSFFETLLPVEDLWWYYFTPEVTTIGFNVFMKTPFILCDVVVGALVYYLIKEKTNDEKKATYGFALWFLCPIVIYMSSIQAMFDTFAVLFLFLSAILVYKGKYFTGGAMLSIAVFAKFFPFYVVFAMIAYIILKNRGDKEATRKNMLLGAGGLIIMTVILHIPMIMEGSLTDSLFFMLSRAETAGVSGNGIKEITASLGYLGLLLLQPLIFAFIIYLAYRLTKSSQEDADKNFFYCLMITTAAVFIWIPAPQYLMIIIPFLVYYVAVHDKRYFWPWLIMTAGATIFAFVMNNFSLFTSLAAYTNLLDLEWVLGIMQWIQQPIFGTSALYLIISVTGFIEAAGIWYILWIWLQDKRKGRAPL
ncbi:MAG: glycosyltransferase family 39 protein [Methanomassiliicoccaceae archaeon]|nr:glycosyltransferase family 39 protein [Methanomassiliicoccaceae archaeon]